MSARCRSLLAVFLVLLHVLAPGLHSLQHAVADARRSSEGAVTCLHCKGLLHADGGARRGSNGESARLAIDESVDEHDCALCAQLNRLHGYVAPSVDVDARESVLARAERARAEDLLQGHFAVLPPARAPPRNES